MQVKTFNLRELKVIRDLNPADINRLISVSGMVTRTSSVIPDLTCAAATQLPPCVHVRRKDMRAYVGPWRNASTATPLFGSFKISIRVHAGALAGGRTSVGKKQKRLCWTVGRHSAG